MVLFCLVTHRIFLSTLPQKGPLLGSMNPQLPRILSILGTLRPIRILDDEAIRNFGFEDATANILKVLTRLPARGRAYTSWLLLLVRKTQISV